MQYLSKAYNYYSGINPATLSGAIDVIVVRHVDADGQVTLACSPFHVRFGKLQVLRAAEKRVTIKMPNNLPAPHTVPFSMKVGESGEAFFVLETTDEVPEELLTSPVVMATDADELSTTPSQSAQPERPSTPRRDTAGLITKEPFGETEKVAILENKPTELGEIDYLDLNASSKASAAASADQNPTASSSSSILTTASSLLPSLPFVGSNHDSTSEKAKPSITRTAKPLPPNPVEARPGQSTDLPLRDHKLSEVSRPADDRASASGQHNEAARTDALPKVRPGAADGPTVLYGKDAVLDMAGYHNQASRSQSLEDSAEHGERSSVRSSVLDSFTRDLLAAIDCAPVSARPALVHHTHTDPDVQHSNSARPVLAADAVSAFEIPFAGHDDEEGEEERRFDRGRSEPPPDLPRTPRTFTRPVHGTALGPPAGASSIAVMDYAWDWGKVPKAPVHPDDVEEYEMEMERSNSGPLIPSGDDRNAQLSANLDLAEVRNQPNPARLGHVEQNPYIFTLTGQSGTSHVFELALCGSSTFAENGRATSEEEAAFLQSRLTFQKFIDDPNVMDDPKLVVRYSLFYLTWSTDGDLLRALALCRRSLASEGGAKRVERPVSGSSWSWWRRKGQAAEAPEASVPSVPVSPSQPAAVETAGKVSDPTVPQFAKTLRLSSDQLKQLNLQPGPNTVHFSVSSSYSGMATCTARIFLWQDTDQIVISDIDGTITKSDALGHVFAAIGRDWTHLGIAKLYTDICNNGYKMMYLTSRAIGQADSTREYLKSITQGDYRLPEGPVIMSPDRLIASLHREVIMRKPELFKMACLRDIQRLFAEKANEAFFAGFGNRITDAMSYRSVGVPTSKIYTIDSTGVVKTELLQAAGHKGSYVGLNDLVNEVFPPVNTAFKPEFTDFNYWRSDVADIPLPDLSPPSPALSARSDSSRYSVLGKIIGRRSSRQPLLPSSEPSSRPSSPLIEPSMTPDEMSEVEDDGRGSMPGSFDKRGQYMPQRDLLEDAEEGRNDEDEGEDDDNRPDDDDDSFDDDAIFDDDILAAGEMKNVPF